MGHTVSIELSIIQKSLSFIGANLQQLKRFQTISLDRYLESFDQKVISERLLELIIQAALDINEHILVQQFSFVPTANKDSFLKMGACGVIANDLATELSKSAGMRNILAHQYLKINYVILLKSIQKALTQYPLYIQQITAYLDSLEEQNG